MLKRLWILTTVMIVVSTLGTHGLLAFTQQLPPYYNCVSLRNVNVSLNRHLTYHDSNQSISVSDSPDGKWQLHQNFGENPSFAPPTTLVNVENGDQIPLDYEMTSYPSFYWSPDSTVFAFLLYLPSDSQSQQYFYHIIFVSSSGEELADHNLETTNGIVILGWSHAGDYFAIRTSDDDSRQHEWIFPAPNFEEPFTSTWNITGEIDYVTRAHAWSHSSNRLAYVVGNSLIFIDPATPTFRLIPMSSPQPPNTYRNNQIAWSPDDRYVAVSTFAAGQKNLQIFDTHSDTPQAVSSIFYATGTEREVPGMNLQFWGDHNMLYYLKIQREISDTIRIELNLLNVETGQQSVIYPEILDYNFDGDTVGLLRKERNVQTVERYKNGQWIEIYSVDTGFIEYVEWFPSVTLITHVEPLTNQRTLNLIHNDGRQYVTPTDATVISHLIESDYISFVLEEASEQRLHLINIKTFEVLRQPQPLEPKQTANVSPMLLSSPDGNFFYIFQYNDGYLVSISDNTWQPIFQNHSRFWAKWSPDSHRILIKDISPDNAHHLWVYEVEDGREWDMGAFPSAEVFNDLSFDQCGDVISILRST